MPRKLAGNTPHYGDQNIVDSLNPDLLADNVRICSKIAMPAVISEYDAQRRVVSARPGG